MPVLAAKSARRRCRGVRVVNERWHKGRRSQAFRPCFERFASRFFNRLSGMNTMSLACSSRSASCPREILPTRMLSRT